MGSKNIIGLLESILEELPKAEKKIAQKILDEPENVIHMTATELGDLSETSAATVIRLTKRLQVSSFTKLKIYISREIESKERESYSDIHPNEEISEIMSKLHWNASLAMKDTVSVLEEEKVLAASNLLKEASVIYVYGIGASNLVADNIMQKWSRIGKTCILINDPHILLAALVGSKKDTVFIGISNSGETKEVIKLNNLARDYGHKTISITRFGGNSLAKKSDIALQHIRANEIETRSAATSSLHAQFLVVDILFYVYVSRNYKNTLEKIHDSRGEIFKYNSFD